MPKQHGWRKRVHSGKHLVAKHLVDKTRDSIGRLFQLPCPASDTIFCILIGIFHYRPYWRFFLIPVILAGGSGTRLWPLSRSGYPKQFLSICGQQTLLQQTLHRLDGIDTLDPIVICNDEHRFLAAEQLRAIDKSASIIIEPCARSTAPAIALAAFQALNNTNTSEVPILLILSADQMIEDHTELQRAVTNLLPSVHKGLFGVIGIQPTKPETGYGYIKQGEEIEPSIRAVNHFIEKPNLEQARKLLSDESVLWNSGIFMIRADRYIEELKVLQPEIHSACTKAISSSLHDMGFVRVCEEAFSSCPEDSIDFALLEPLSHQQPSKIAVSTLECFWSDIGAWNAIWEQAEKDTNGNAVLGSTDHIHSGSQGCLIHSDSRLVTTLGLDNTIVIDTKDALLVAQRDQIQNIKSLIGKLKHDGRNELDQHKIIYRPWGYYESIDLGERYQVKRITVNPGARLSLQVHHHRAEHWVVVSGTAKVVNGHKAYLVTENESTFIPLGQPHSLENPGTIPLRIIEIQSGSYLGEDDIVRLETYY